MPETWLMGSGFYSGSFTTHKLATETCTTCGEVVESDEIFYDDYDDRYILCPQCGDGVPLTYDEYDY